MSYFVCLPSFFFFLIYLTNKNNNLGIFLKESTFLNSFISYVFPLSYLFVFFVAYFWVHWVYFHCSICFEFPIKFIYLFLFFLINFVFSSWELNIWLFYIKIYYVVSLHKRQKFIIVYALNNLHFWICFTLILLRNIKKTSQMVGCCLDDL